MTEETAPTETKLASYVNDTEAQQVSVMSEDSKEKEKEPSCLELGVQCTVENISDINTSTQTFNCRIKFKISWIASNDDINDWENNNGKNNLNWIPLSFKPQLTFPNALSPPDITIKDDRDRYYSITQLDSNNNNNSNIKYVSYDFLAHGIFVEPFELQSFPFDVQDLRIQLKLDHKSKIINDPLLVSYKFIPNILSNDFIKFDLTNSVTTEWAIHPPIVEFGWSDPKESKKGHRYPLFEAKIKIERNTNFYLSRVCVTLALFSILSFTIFTIPPDSVADRLSIMFTVLLTIIAYQLVVSSLLPVLNFLTFIDKYMSCNILFLGLIVLENGFVGYFANNDIENDGEISDNTKNADTIFFYLMIVMWIIIHLLFIIWGYKTKKRELMKLKMGKTELKQNGFEEATTIGANDSFFIKNTDITDKMKKQMNTTWDSVTMISNPK